MEFKPMDAQKAQALSWYGQALDTIKELAKRRDNFLENLSAMAANLDIAHSAPQGTEPPRNRFAKFNFRLAQELLDDAEKVQNEMMSVADKANKYASQCGESPVSFS